MNARTVALIAVSSVALGWVLGSVVSPPVARVQSLPERPRARVDQREAPPVVFTEKLQLRLQQAPAPPTPRRNPFIFGRREAPAPPPVAPREPSSTEPSIVPPDSGPLPVPGPVLKLSGIGSKVTPDGIVRTAIISDGEDVHLVKAGDVVSGFAVVEVAEDGVTLANAAGAQWKLRLK